MTREDYQRAKHGIAIRLQQMRKKLGLTQAKLGELSGTNQAVIQKIENGKSRSPRIIEDLAFALDVNPAWLQWGEPFAPMLVERAIRNNNSAREEARMPLHGRTETNG